MVKRAATIGAMLCLALMVPACSSSRPPRIEPPSPRAAHDPLVDEYRAELERTARVLRLPIAETRSFDLEMEIPRHGSVEAAIEYFSGPRRETIQSSFLRSAPWIPMIHEILVSQGLPPDLSYLPVIESGYRLTLTSRAGAHGMWQFMASTAREYGLRVDWWVDERADPWKATTAAARYLSDLHRTFGDWPLALAAYNCGPGCVRRTLEKEGVETFWELLERGALPRETRGYVPTFYATIVLAGSPERFGFLLPATARPDFDEVVVQGPVSLSYLAETTRLDPETLKDLNGELHRGIVPPGRWSLRVPRGSGRLVADRAWKLEDPSVGVASYVSGSGESLRALATRIGVDERELRAINGLRGDRVPAGRTLWVPLHQTELSARLTHASSGPSWHVVEAGDTLYSIARRNGLTVAELVDLNRLGSDLVIHPGDRLIVKPPAVGTSGM